MPIRIKKDSGGYQQERRTSGGPGGGNIGGSGLAGAILPMIFNLFRRNPKLAIILIIVGIAIYFILGRTGSSSPESSMLQSLMQGTGLFMDERVYDSAEVFEPLADNINNPLPEKVTLKRYCPTRLNQGSQGSCVGWASAYAARTILYSKATGENPDDLTFSPSYVYNQIALPNCQGTYLQRAMDVMHNEGALPFSNFAYDENSCSDKPSQTEREAATDYKIKGFNRLSRSGDDYKTDLLAIKQNIAQGAPVVIGMMVGGSFMSSMAGEDIWIPDETDYAMKGFGGHAMCVIGYDDYIQGGAFQLMNSWGEEWGNEGIAWIRYNDFEYFTREAYGLYPMGDAEKVFTTMLDIEIGLVLNKSGAYVPFEYNSGILFETTEKLNPQDEFKVAITNSVECYTYIFGEETDGSSYVLFPYTKKHSPYCGITGQRLFPKDYSLFPDEKGTKDRLAIVISRQILDYIKLNEAINNSAGNTYEEKVTNTLKDELATDLKFAGGKTLKISSDSKNKNTIALLLEINKN
ncbi:MAG: hypothetical protein JXB00_06450 [Bacteroidales bacterium]|nr:hypothetical protein [Bacteroidales bacterium]